MAEFELPAETHIAFVHLRVADLEAQLHFYRDVLGFRTVRQEGETTVLSASGEAPYHIVLTQTPGARPRPRRTTGLFHVAIRYPNRRALALALYRLAETRWPIGGASDHQVSEAIYLDDAEGNGIELYVDRPRAAWAHDDGQVAMTTTGLDLDALLAEAGSPVQWTGIDPATDIGHVHLQVSSLARAEAFYHGVLGFDVTQRSYQGALFMSAGGYHHHVGANIWASRDATPPPPGSTGLIAFGLALPSDEAWNAVAARLDAAAIAVEPVSMAEPGTKGILVHDADQIGVVILAPVAVTAC